MPHQMMMLYSSLNYIFESLKIVLWTYGLNEIKFHQYKGSLIAKTAKNANNAILTDQPNIDMIIKYGLISN